MNPGVIFLDVDCLRHGSSKQVDGSFFIYKKKKKRKTPTAGELVRASDHKKDLVFDNIDGNDYLVSEGR